MDRVEHTTQQAEAIYANSSASNGTHDHNNGQSVEQQSPTSSSDLMDIDDPPSQPRSRVTSFSRGELLEFRRTESTSPAENVPFRQRLSSFGLLTQRDHNPVINGAGAITTTTSGNFPADEKQNRRMLGLFLRENAP